MNSKYSVKVNTLLIGESLKTDAGLANFIFSRLNRTHRQSYTPDTITEIIKESRHVSFDGIRLELEVSSHNIIKEASLDWGPGFIIADNPIIQGVIRDKKKSTIDNLIGMGFHDAIHLYASSIVTGFVHWAYFFGYVTYDINYVDIQKEVI